MATTTQFSSLFREPLYFTRLSCLFNKGRTESLLWRISCLLVCCYLLIVSSVVVRRVLIVMHKAGNMQRKGIASQQETFFGLFASLFSLSFEQRRTEGKKGPSLPQRSMWRLLLLAREVSTGGWKMREWHACMHA